MSFNNKKNSNADQNVDYKNINIKGQGFINQLRLVQKGGQRTLIAKLSLQQGKVIGGNYDKVETVFFESVIFDDKIKATLIEGLFENVSTKDGVTTVKPEKTLSGAFSFSNISRIDIVDNKPSIHSPIIGAAYIVYDDNFVIDNRKSSNN